MAKETKARVRKHDDPKQHWICEEETCEKTHIDKSPPDVCSGCGGTMFANLFDMMMASGTQTDHAA